MRMMKKEELHSKHVSGYANSWDDKIFAYKDGALDLKKNSCEIPAPNMQSIVPRTMTRKVRVGSAGSSDSGTICKYDG